MMLEEIRMNQKIPKVEDPELYEYLSKFNSRGRAYQARKLMMLGLVQLGMLNGGESFPHKPSSEPEGIEDEAMNENELIGAAGVDALF